MGTIILIVILALLVAVVLLNFKKFGSFFRRLKVFLGEVSTEMRKVTWPSKDEVVNSTILVLVSVLAMTMVFWVVDLVIGIGMRVLFKVS